MDDIFINYTNHARNRLILNEPDYVNKQGLTLGQVEENRLEQKRTARLQERLKKNHELMKYFI